MKREFCQTKQGHACGEEWKTVSLFPGIELAYPTLTDDHLLVQHKKPDDVLVINYCKSGRIGWKMESGNYVYLGVEDFSVCTGDVCANAEISLPNGRYEGLFISVDLRKLTDNPPELLRGTGITGAALRDKLLKSDRLISVAGNEYTEAIFRFFFHQSPPMQLPYQKIKVVELLLYLYNTENLSDQHVTECRAEQIEIIRQIHQQLLGNLEKRVTIEELSKRYLMNPTTMKALFKSVYGSSIAAHMKEHRMREAAKLLLESEMNVSEIAGAVGYDSQSKFSEAFMSYFQMLPKEYRKKH